jgi:hypothetical protein
MCPSRRTNREANSGCRSTKSWASEQMRRASPGALAQFICHFHNWRLGLEDAAAATNALTQIKGLVGGVRLRRRRQQPLSTAPPSLKSVRTAAARSLFRSLRLHSLDAIKLL